MAKGKSKTFLIHDDFCESCRELTDAQAGKLWKAIAMYRLDGKQPTFSGKDKMLLGILFGQFQRAYDVDRAAYREKCQRNSENQKKRWGKAKEKSYTNVYERIPSNTKSNERIPSNTDYDYDCDCDIQSQSKDCDEYMSSSSPLIRAVDDEMELDENGWSDA